MYELSSELIFLCSILQEKMTAYYSLPKPVLKEKS